VVLVGINPGTDISQARNSFLSGENSDFLGILLVGLNYCQMGLFPGRFL